MKDLKVCFLLLGLFGCNEFISPDEMAEGVEADERCNNWKEETRKETIRFGLEYTLFYRSCQLNHEITIVLGYEESYETGNSRQDKEIQAAWHVVTAFQL
jgi:hypothetical protein